MKTLLTITDLTRMQGNRVCIAGYTRDGTCVRPVFPPGRGITEGWLYSGDEPVIRPWAQVEFDLLQKKPAPPHTEDWLIHQGYRVRKGMVLPLQQQAALKKIADPNVATIFAATIHHDVGYYVMAGEGSRSLGTVAAEEIEVHYTLRPPESWEYRMSFRDRAGQDYRLAVPDLAFRYFLDHRRIVEGADPAEAARCLTEVLRAAEVHLRIGLARGWEKYPDRCYLQITGVYSFPDYLGGRCFADFGRVANGSVITRPRRRMEYNDA